MIFFVLRASSHTLSDGFLGLLALLGILYIVRTLLWKHADPKDYGYCVFAEFGPEMRIPRDQRLREQFPRLASDTLTEWLADYQRLTEWIGCIADRGGADSIGRAETEQACMKSFPWLRRRGLRTAMFLTNYIASK
jgi:hypothetical protein